jgi:ribose 5-phosphate isomerase B
MKIYLGTDHAGFELKEALKAALTTAGHTVEDMGAHSYDAGDDYPDFVVPVARAVSADPENSKGIILGATGEGEAITANRFPNVRAIVYYGKHEGVVNYDSDIIIRSREHNNSNVLSLGARYFNEETMMNAVDLWLKTPFPGEERHVRRLKKIDAI